VRMISGEDYTSSSFSPCSIFHSYVTSPLLGPNICLSTLFSNTFSRWVRGQVSRPRKKQAKL